MGRDQSAVILSLDSLIGSVDEKIAHFFLSGGISLKNLIRNEGFARCWSKSGDKYLEARYGCIDHTENVSSLRRCIAACAYYVLSVMLKADDRNLTQLDENNDPKYNGSKIINAFAEAHGFPRENDLYFMFNVDQQFLVEKYPVKGTALSRWKYKYRDIITSGRKQVTFEQEFSTCFVYYKLQAESKGISINELMDEYTSQMLACDAYLMRLLREFEARGRFNLAERLLAPPGLSRDRIVQFNFYRYR